MSHIARTMCDICSNLTMLSVVIIINFEQISHTVFWCFHFDFKQVIFRVKILIFEGKLCDSRQD